MSPVADACAACLHRSWLVGALSGRLETVRARIFAVLALADGELVRALGVDSVASLGPPGPEALAESARGAGLSALCRCSARYPRSLRDLAAPPAVLYLAGDPDRVLDALAGEVVAIVGARRATRYGHRVAERLGDALTSAGITVVSGMALGIDGAAHRGALGRGDGDGDGDRDRDGDGTGDSIDVIEAEAEASTPARAPTVAVLPGPPGEPYPPSHRRLHARILASGGAVSELPPGAAVRRWTFPARNRIIAALATMTVVVEAAERSGSLVTARVARELGSSVGAVPGQVTARMARGPNALLAGGARVVRGPEDVLAALFGEDPPRLAALEPPRLPAHLQALLDALSDGEGTARAIAAAGLGPSGGVAALAELELAGRLRRGAGGFEVVP